MYQTTLRFRMAIMAGRIEVAIPRRNETTKYPSDIDFEPVSLLE
jgi:hypothetical protein